jgi:glycine cleavage system regulatory protein
MTVSLVFAVIGPDRPGLVQRLAATVADHDGNWFESRMARLGGKFAGVVLASVPDAGADALRRSLTAFEREGLHVVVEDAPGAEAPHAYRRVRLDVFGQDHPGIVRDISRALSERGVNIAEMETERSTGAMSAEAMFRLQADIELPVEVETAALRAALEDLAGDIMVELVLAEETDGYPR